MSKLLTKSAVSLGVALAMGASGVASGASHAGGGPKFEFHGDLNNRFLVYTDQANHFGQRGTSSTKSEENFGEFKYRMWTTAETNDGGVKGVYAIEIGGVRFGRSGVGRSQGGSFSGDGANVETRWAYVDLGLPSNKATRVKIGLQPFSVNQYKWSETAGGVQLVGKASDTTSYKVGWARGRESFLSNPDELGDDLDLFFARVDFSPAEGTTVGVFGLVERADNPAGTGAIDVSARNADGTPKGLDGGGSYEVKFIPDNFDINIVTVGLDGSYKPSNWFLNWSLLYQDGSIDGGSFTGTNGNTVTGNFDLQAWFFGGDLGVNLGNTTVKYTLLYASGDDNSNDNDFDAFIATDVDNSETVSFQEGGEADDFYFVEVPYIADKGYILNKLTLSQKVSAKTTVAAHVAYILTAEDIVYVDDNGIGRADDKLGTEVALRLKHMIYPNLEFQTTASFLAADSAMDFFNDVRNGNNEEDIFRWDARVRYKF